MADELNIVSGLLVYGPLGVFNVIQVFAIRGLFKRMGEREDAFRKEMREREEAHAGEIARRDAEHRAEMMELSERHIAATNTWTQHYQTWAERATAVLEALYRRAGRR